MLAFEALPFVVLINVRSVMMLTTSHTTTTRMLSVLSYTSEGELVNDPSRVLAALQMKC